MVGIRRLFSIENRGILLDVIVFLFNLLLMSVLARLFAELSRAENDSYNLARLGVILFCLGLAFLQPIASLLKRRRAHERNPGLERPKPQLLFHPFFYFLSKLVFLIGGAGLLVDMLYADFNASSGIDFFGLPPTLFTVLFLGVPGLAIANTAIVYFYFRKPSRPALLKFLESPQSEAVADVCLFLNMIGYQMFWAMLMADLPHDYSSIVSRLSTFAFSALLIYLPPRLFYLAEDGDRPSTWLMMLLANTPVLVRILLK